MVDPVELGSDIGEMHCEVCNKPIGVMVDDNEDVEMTEQEQKDQQKYNDNFKLYCLTCYIETRDKV